jgi:hypothetical protein
VFGVKRWESVTKSSALAVNSNVAVGYRLPNACSFAIAVDPSEDSDSKLSLLTVSLRN